MNTALSLRYAATTLIRLLLAGLLLIAWAGLPDSLYSAPAAAILYVAPGGSDLNACTSATLPCEHIQAAINKAASGYTINIAAGTYIEPLTITDKNLTVKGQGAASTFLDGNNSFQILAIHRETAPSVTVNLSGVTLRNGSTGDAGAAIAVEANCFLTLSDSVIAGNTTTSSSGGGILNSGTLKLINVTVRDNRASQEGGGIFNSGKLELTNVLLTDNDASKGGGISNRVAVTVTASYIISNTSSGLGGGIYSPAGSLVLLNSTLSGNAAIGDGGAIYNGGILTSTKTVIQLNQAANNGGGIYSFTASKTTLTYNVIQNNTALFGGGLFNGGIAQIFRTSITNNVANNSGGGLNNGGPNNAGTTALANVTVSDNTAPNGSGILNTGPLSMNFSTISHNNLQASGGVTAGNSILDNACTAPIASTGYNIDTGTVCGFAGPGDLSNTNPQLGPLQDNGGGTLTRAIGLSSAAVDSANDAVCPPADQRGLPRPQGDHCDRGAYEVMGYSKVQTLDIGPSACTTSILPIVDQYYVGRIMVGVNLTYPNRADLRIRLLSPGNSAVNLLGPAANPGANLDTLFDDSAASGVPGGFQDPSAPYYNYVFKPATPLAQMRGIGIKGDWKLEICNSSASQQGTLNRWKLVVPEVVSYFKLYLPLIRR